MFSPFFLAIYYAAILLFRFFERLCIVLLEKYFTKYQWQVFAGHKKSAPLPVFPGRLRAGGAGIVGMFRSQNIFV